MVIRVKTGNEEKEPKKGERRTHTRKRKMSLKPEPNHKGKKKERTGVGRRLLGCAWSVRMFAEK